MGTTRVGGTSRRERPLGPVWLYAPVVVDESLGETLPGPVVVLLAPGRLPEPLPAAVSRICVPVPFDDLASAGPHRIVGAATAALAADVLLVVVGADLGIDPTTAKIWQIAADAGVPRAVAVTALGDGRADIEDIAAIAGRMFGDECVLWRLPVFDDDGELAGSLDLARGVLRVDGKDIPSSRAHRRVSVGARLRLLEALSGVIDDPDTAQRALSIAADASDDDPDSDLPIWGEPDVWDVSRHGVDAFRSGELAPVLPATEDWDDVAQLLQPWSAAGGPTVPRFVRRNAEGEATDGPAAVVLAAEGDWALVRTVYGPALPAEGLLTMTRTGVGLPESGDDGWALAPYRAWPVGVVDRRSATAGESAAEDLSWQRLRLTLRPQVGDVLALDYLWLVNEQLA
ncbi:MAG: hypothetical protein H6525_06190 [Actinobacteria bacterium]|nr:hypothetical protein [Actinomycetota bacterium]MCB9412419.1 hypothetical protein [Actinomycetota bacterium]